MQPAGIGKINDEYHQCMAKIIEVRPNEFGSVLLTEEWEAGPPYKVDYVAMHSNVRATP
jgi:hypothetical protein